MQKVEELFRLRDEAVRHRDREAFVSTQLGSIPDSSPSGYFSWGNLTTEVVAVVDTGPDTKGVLVRETYGGAGVEEAFKFVLYHLVKISTAWRIYRQVY
ncbi:MAG: hypothetical protein JWP40_4291 [Blastococcus sp.]|nr:hypothetical protein [Blastococcus sp.]